MEPRTQAGEEVAGAIEDEPTAAARRRGHVLGCAPVDAATGAVLAFVAAARRAKAAVEVGTGSGVSGLYLLSGMPPEGVLTSIDVEPEHHRAARRGFSDAGFAPGRTRLIIGRGLDVLPRLTGAGYDLVFVDAPRLQYPRYHEHAVGLLRAGGVLAFAGVRSVEVAESDPEAVALREIRHAVTEDERLVPALLPLHDAGGLLVAAKR